MGRVGVSLFSGAGGMDVGFAKAGIEIAWANDIVADACSSYEANHGPVIQHGDIRDFLPGLSRFEGVDVLIGGPPCQGFSVAGKMDPEDHRSQLVHTYMDALDIVRPLAFVLENVRALGELEKFRDVREQLIRRATSLGYDCTLVVLNASDFGVPQARTRMFLAGFRGGALADDFLRHLHTMKRPAPTLRHIVTSLGRAGTPANARVCRAKISIAARPVLRKSPYAGMLFNGQGRPLNPDGYASTLPASMGGNRTPIIDEMHLFDGATSWVEEYHAHLMAGGKPADAAPPARLRRLTVDEALLLQTFPANYKFVGAQSSIFTQIGNAVPCDLAFAVAESVRRTLDGTVCEEDASPQFRLAV